MGDNISTVVFTVGHNNENVVGLEYVDRYRELTWLNPCHNQCRSQGP